MKAFLVILLAINATACAGLSNGGSNFDLDKFVNNPNCAHHDEINGVTGAAGIPASLQFKASRDCPVTQLTGPPVLTVLGAQPPSIPLVSAASTAQ